MLNILNRRKWRSNCVGAGDTIEFVAFYFIYYNDEKGQNELLEF